MNGVPTDVHLLSLPPARQLPICTPEEANENRSQKAHFPVHIVYVPPNGASCVTALRPCHAADLSGQSCSAEVYNTRDVRQPVSSNANQSFQTNGKVQYTTGYAPSQVNASEGLMKVPIQYSCQSTFEGYCRPTGKEISALNHRIDSMNSVHQETPPDSKSNAMLVALTGRPDYVAQAICQLVSAQGLTTSSPRFRSMNDHVPATEPNNISRNAYSAFQGQGKSRGGPNSNVNSWIAPKQQPHNQNSGDDFKYGGPSSWSNNIDGYASSHITRSYPTILTHDPRVCDSLTTTEEPRCYISVDSKPQGQGDKKKEQFKFSEAVTRCQEVQSHDGRMPCIDQEQRAKKLEKLTQFVVGVEKKIHWNKIRNNNKKSNRSEEGDVQIVSVSSTHSPRDDPTETHSNSSQSESDDAFCMIRLERVYYSTNAIPSRHAQSAVISQEQGSKPSEFGVDAQKGKLTSLPGDTHQIIANCEYSSKQSSSVASRNKTSKGLPLVTKVHKTAHVPDACSVKRKADVNSTKTDGVWNAKQKKMEKNKSKVSPKGTVTTALREVNKSVEILSTKELTVQLDCDGKTFLEDLKKISEETDARIIRERVRKRCSRKARINS